MTSSLRAGSFAPRSKHEIAVNTTLPPLNQRCSSPRTRGLERKALSLLGALLLISSGASAQEEVGTGTGAEVAEPAPAQQAPADDSSEEKRTLYYKKVQGLLWIEAFVGPTTYDPDQFGSVSIEGTTDAPKLNGPEWGLAVLLGFGGSGIGAFYRQANFGQYQLMKVGLEVQGIFTYAPYVHPMIRLDIGYARTFGGNPYNLPNTDSDGLVATFGLGVRVPIIRWMSFAATFDWSFVGLVLRGRAPDGSDFASSVLGQQLGATFALTFHFFGVRKN